MDFIDLQAIAIVDQDANELGTLICQDTQSIYSETFKPVMTDPKLLRWRSVVRATYEAFYPAP